MSKLREFKDDNRTFQDTGKRVNWNNRLLLIKRHFPNIEDVNWERTLRDNDIFARIVRDILKAQQHLGLSDAQQSVAGRKPNIEIQSGMSGWRELIGRSSSDLPFPQAFRILTSDRATGKHHSLSMIANKTGISRSRVHRLMSGLEEPDMRDMEMIAAGYKKKPSFFVEYRISTIIGYLAMKLESDPEIATSIYEMIVK